MTSFLTPGQKFRESLRLEKPLQIVGTINAYTALLAKKAGFKALYLSGAGVANAAFGLPDLGLTSLTEVVEEARRITNRVDLPLLVDIDTGWGSRLNIQRCIQTLIEIGAAAAHLEDQDLPKRCGHRAGKKLVSSDEMIDKIKTAVATRNDSKIDPHFVLIARTDAIAVEGLEKAIERAKAYQDNGADLIFAEAITQLSDYKRFTEALKIPVLANITEFGLTPLLTVSELQSVGVACVLYPLSAFRAMSKAALTVYETLRKEGSQQSLLPQMQTREELYEILDYYAFEAKLNKDAT